MDEVFLAIDFETANNKRISACAVGLAWIKNGEVIKSEKHFIKPPAGEKFTGMHRGMHGIGSDHVKDAPTFDELWVEVLKDYCATHTLVLHNASMDASIIRSSLEHYGILDYEVNYFDTMKIADKHVLPKRLVEMCEKYDVPFKNMHDPMEDAMVCGLVFSHMIKQGLDVQSGLQKMVYSPPRPKATDVWSTTEVYNNNLSTIEKYGIRDPIEIDVNKKSFVLTGELDEERGFYKKILAKHGRFVRSSISGSTHYVVVGKDFGPSKITQIENFNSNKNKSIKIITPIVFYEFIKGLEN